MFVAKTHTIKHIFFTTSNCTIAQYAFEIKNVNQWSWLSRRGVKIFYKFNFCANV